MKTMKILFRTLLIILSIATLSACGGGGGGGSDDTADATGTIDVPDQTVSKSFTLTLASVDVRRVSNGDPVNVEILGINSGSLTLGQRKR
jgi:hypothetical protein